MNSGLFVFYPLCIVVATITVACSTQDKKPLSDHPTVIVPDTPATALPDSAAVSSQIQATESVPFKQDPELVQRLIREALHHPRYAQFIEIRDSTKRLLNYRAIPDGIEISDTLASGNRYVVRITKKIFDLTQHRITRKDDRGVTQIDGKAFWGSDGGLPRYEIKHIEIFINDRAIAIPKKSWRNYYEPSLYLPDSIAPAHTTVYESRNARYCYLYMSNSDGAGAYDVKFVFDHRKHITDFALLNPLGLEIDGVID